MNVSRRKKKKQSITLNIIKLQKSNLKNHRKTVEKNSRQHYLNSSDKAVAQKKKNCSLPINYLNSRPIGVKLSTVLLKTVTVTHLSFFLVSQKKFFFIYFLNYLYI